MTNSLLILFPSQLFETKYIDKVLNFSDETTTKSKNNFIVLWEHEHFFHEFPYHKMKLAFHRATMQCYFDMLKTNKYKVEYIESIEKNQEQKIIQLIKSHDVSEIRLFNPIEKKLINLVNSSKLLGKFSIEYLMFPSVYFLGSASFEINNQIKSSLTTTRHDLFYKYQRIKYDVMVKKTKDKIEPEGGKWSFDTENRSPFEKTQQEPPLPKYTSKSRSEYIDESIEYINKNYNKNYGTCLKENFIYPISHEEASKWLDQFVETKLSSFGKYEDAISSKIKFGFHSLLSSVNNVGLITTKQILKKIKNYKKNLASKEGFIRQIIGWREYCYYVYDLHSESLISTSIYNLNKKSIPKKIWEGKTLIPVIDNILSTVNSYAYSHHIERLMGVGNFLLLIQVSPEQIYLWFQSMYIDAYDVFMVPNVFGMLLYGSVDNKTKMMTRPYFCSSNYLMKMSDFKSSEMTFGNITCKWDEVFDALYYYNISRYSDIFKKIYATASAVYRWEKFNAKRKEELIDLAKKYIDWIHK
jgi:deoxyribodipyrimidine photolyase-related protein